MPGMVARGAGTLQRMRGMMDPGSSAQRSNRDWRLAGSAGTTPGGARVLHFAPDAPGTVQAADGQGAGQLGEEAARQDRAEVRRTDEQGNPESGQPGVAEPDEGRAPAERTRGLPQGPLEMQPQEQAPVDRGHAPPARALGRAPGAAGGGGMAQAPEDEERSMGERRRSGANRGAMGAWDQPARDPYYPGGQYPQAPAWPTGPSGGTSRPAGLSWTGPAPRGVDPLWPTGGLGWTPHQGTAFPWVWHPAMNQAWPGQAPAQVGAAGWFPGDVGDPAHGGPHPNSRHGGETSQGSRGGARGSSSRVRWAGMSEGVTLARRSGSSLPIPRGRLGTYNDWLLPTEAMGTVTPARKVGGLTLPGLQARLDRVREPREYKDGYVKVEPKLPKPFSGDARDGGPALRAFWHDIRSMLVMWEENGWEIRQFFLRMGPLLSGSAKEAYLELQEPLMQQGERDAQGEPLLDEWGRRVPLQDPVSYFFAELERRYPVSIKDREQEFLAFRRRPEESP